jgi:hypothetical protein
MATLEIGSSSSKCSACKKGANPYESRHDTVWEYSPDSGQPGCGEEFDHATIVYMNGYETGAQMINRLMHRGFAPNLSIDQWSAFGVGDFKFGV